MKVLVTGANGFIGRRLCARLEADGHSVEKFDVDCGDLTQANALDGVADVDYVYHLAARTFVPASWDQPHSFYQNNVMGMATVLEYCRVHYLPLTTLSTYVYGAPQYLPIDEKHSLHAPSPYHESKLLCESLCSFYADAYGLSVRVLRPFNVYGAGQSDAFLLPKIMKQTLSSEYEAIEVFDLSPKRDYVYIDDLVSAMILAQSPWQGLQTFNVGMGISTSVREAIETIQHVTGIVKPYYATQEARRGEIDDCYADITKSKEILGFTPKYSLEQGIVKWVGEL